MHSKRLKILSVMIFLFACVASTYAQSESNNWSIIAKRIWLDHESPQIDNLIFKNFGQMKPLGAVNGVQASLGVSRDLGRLVAIDVPVRFGTADFYKDENTLRNAFFWGVDIQPRLMGRWKESQILVPYLTAGFGFATGKNIEPAYTAPIGLGIDVQFAPSVYLNFATHYRAGGFLQEAFQHDIGLRLEFPGDEEEVVPEPVAPLDTDGDGVADMNDLCPTEAGPASLSGCPDTDSDGIADVHDSCPTVAGIAALNGCPDTDGDGITDTEDNCPNEAGPRDNKGCPITDRDRDGTPDLNDKCPDTPGLMTLSGCPDADKDGVADGDDNCPNEAGPAATKGCPDTDGDGVMNAIDDCPELKGIASNHGCPEIKEVHQTMIDNATSLVSFRTGSSMLTKESEAVLNKVASVMQQYPYYSLSISGHTDNTGNPAFNQTLSEKRAKTCFDYLVAKGVASARMSYAGYGDTRPITSNKTKAERDMNRRTEFNMFIK